MDSTATAIATARPLGTVGSSFYFAPQSVERGEAIGLDVIAFYAAGRAGVIGDRPVDEVDSIFFFFKSGLVAAMVETSRTIASREVAVAAHIEAADAYAAAALAGVPVDVLERFTDATYALVDTLPMGRWPIVDGYRSLGRRDDAVSDAYRAAILLRELRGGLHTEIVQSSGLTAAAACQLDQGGAYFALHGYNDDDRVEETAEVLAARSGIEDATDAAMAEILETLTATQRGDLVTGVEAMLVAVTG
ncbi:MAG: hypothetical protein WCI12_06400 [Actinomycetes bacterium]